MPPQLMETPRRSSRIWTLFFLFSLVAIAGGTIWIRTETVRETYEYVQKEKELSRLESQWQSEKVRWLRVTHPGKLTAMADKTGLRPATSEQFRRVPESVLNHGGNSP